jgi:phosphatidate cytidylyltransferase
MLRTRVITALVLLAAFLCVLFVLPRPAAAAAFALIAAVAAWEWAGLLAAGVSGRATFAAAVLASCLGAYCWPATTFHPLWSASALFWLGLIPFWLWRHWSLAAHRPPGYVVGWLIVVPTWAAMYALYDRSPWLLFAAMALVWVADIAAYFTGRTFGKRKLAPDISPGKTWEGVAGAMVGTLVYGVAAAMVAGMPMTANFGWFFFLPVLTAVSIAGDLFESLLKRQAGAKDSGRILPGHGGVLDRIDSQTSTLPLLALVVHWSLG